MNEEEAPYMVLRHPRQVAWSPSLGDMINFKHGHCILRGRLEGFRLERRRVTEVFVVTPDGRRHSIHVSGVIVASLGDVEAAGQDHADGLILHLASAGQSTS